MNHSINSNTINKISKSTNYFQKILAPLRNDRYRSVLAASSFSYIGTWMHNIGATWLMMNLTSSTIYIALVQAATTLPILLFAIIGGIFADNIALPKYIAYIQLIMGFIAILLGLCTFIHFINPLLLLIFTFILGSCAALVRPAWLASAQYLVTKEDVPQALIINSMNFNLSRVIGPAIGGAIIEYCNIAIVFFFNGISYLSMVYIFFKWHSENQFKISNKSYQLQQVIISIKNILKSKPFRIVIFRTILFFINSSAIFTFLPLISRYELQRGSSSYGLLISSLSVGAIIGGFILSYIRTILSPDQITIMGTIVFSLSLIGLSHFHNLIDDITIICMGGIAWISMVTTLNNLAINIVPEHAKTKAISIYIMAFSGSQALGNILYGWLANILGCQTALFLSGLFLLLSLCSVPLFRLDNLSFP